MSSKGNKCCCCPECSGATECCECTCRRLCVTFHPTLEEDSDYTECLIDSQELAWNGTSFSGTVNSHDVMYYFERVGGECYFKLRSDSLGFPIGYEYQWLMTGDYAEVSCASLATSLSVPQDGSDECSAGTIDTICAVKILPSLCTGCNCTCDCICITYIDSDIGCRKKIKACWSESEQGYSTTITCGEADYPITVLIRLEPADEYDTACKAVLYLDGDTYEPLEPSCPDMSATWDVTGIEGGYATLSMRCAECEETCETRLCCPSLPDVLYLTISTPCFNGVLTLEIQDPILPNDTIVWETPTAQPLTQCTCDLISGLDICTDDTWVAFATCVPASGGSPAYISVSIGPGGGGGDVFQAHYLGCNGGVMTPSTAILYNFVANCCGNPGSAQGGTVTLSA